MKTTTPTANAQDVTAKTITRSPELVAAYNASVRDGTQTEDPRQDFNHPLHDIVCGWCGEVHLDTLTPRVSA